MSRPAIEAHELGKAYRIGLKAEAHVTFREAMVKAFRSSLRGLGKSGAGQTSDDQFWALKDVSFAIEPGEAIGIIGRNGAGKSTLLKILSRITEPTTGSARLRGRVASLLEVGTGFHQELTGRENIYLNGAILGMRKAEIDRKFDEIVAFSEIEKFLDTPVKRYSSGMYVRLAFAVAAHLDPEILIVDEVLAVGDAAFQKKCLGKMQDVATAQHKTILFVSHNLGAISTLTTRCLLMDQGRLQFFGPTADAVSQYLSSSYKSGSRWEMTKLHENPMQLLAAEIRADDGRLTNELDVLKDFEIVLEYEVRRPLQGAVVAVIIHAWDGALLFSTEDTDTQTELLYHRAPGRYRSAVKIPGGLLNKGDFHVRVGLGLPGGREVYDNTECLQFTLIDTGDHRTRAHRSAAYFLPTLPWRFELLEEPVEPRAQDLEYSSSGIP
jgi:lipopolysaccharide transport system ATP-binding protein